MKVAIEGVCAQVCVYVAWLYDTYRDPSVINDYNTVPPDNPHTAAPAFYSAVPLPLFLHCPSLCFYRSFCLARASVSALPFLLRLPLPLPLLLLPLLWALASASPSASVFAYALPSNIKR